MKNARFRVDGERFQLLVESHTAFDPDTAFIEYWIVAGGGDYLYFRAAYQSGTSTLQGYDAVNYFTTIYSPEVEIVGDAIVLSWPVEVMAMSVNFLSVGMGAGWCSAETENYCDHAPDAWGHYYTGFDSSDFYTIRW